MRRGAPPARRPAAPPAPRAHARSSPRAPSSAVHDYYARARYIQKVLERTEELRDASARLAEGILRQQQLQEQEQRQQAHDARLRSLHHLLSTKSMPGVLDGLGFAGAEGPADAGKAYGDIESKIKTLNKSSVNHRHALRAEHPVVATTMGA